MNMEFTRKDLNYLHDTVYDAVGIEEPDERLIERFNNLPESVKSIAVQKGFDDTEFEIQFYQHLISDRT
jgi:hypothetical protein